MNPALLAHQPGIERPSVVVLHGLSASKECHGKELESLSRAGFYAIAPDAPHHGERRTAWLDEMARATGAEAHLLFLRMLPNLVDDVLRLVAELHATGHGPVGLVGISMGAFTALAAAARDTRVDCTVSILGSPDWVPRDGAVTPEMQPLMAGAPVHQAGSFAPRPLFMANAGLDVNVPAAASRRFAEVLRPLYSAVPERLEYVEYPESGHAMREADWNELWGRVLRFVRRHLVEQPSRER